MNKKVIENFMRRFSLGGIIDQAELKYCPKENRLICATGVLPNKDLLVRVDMPFVEWENKYDTDLYLPFFSISRLRKMISPFGDDDIKLDVEFNDETPIAVTFSDDYSEVRCVLCDPSIIGIKFWKLQSIPEFHVELDNIEEFIPRFLKASNSMRNENKGFDTLFTLINKNGKLDLVINYSSSSNTNRHCIHLNAKEGDLERQLTFNSEHLRNVLNENANAKHSKIEISNVGFMKLEFQYELMTSLYILTATKIGK